MWVSAPILSLPLQHKQDKRSSKQFLLPLIVGAIFTASLCAAATQLNLMFYLSILFISPDKDKPLDSDEDSMGISAGGPGGVGGTPGSGPLRPNSQSAFLGPMLWERTLPCDGGLFQLQYMDLEEFLTENGMGMQNGPSSTSAQIPSQVRPTAVRFFPLWTRAPTALMDAQKQLLLFV